MLQQYMVIDDKLVPEDVAPLVLAEKLKGNTAPPVTSLIHFSKNTEWKLPSAAATEENNTRAMIKKMAAVNKLEKAVLQVRIYPGSPAVRVITCVKIESLIQS